MVETTEKLTEVTQEIAQLVTKKMISPENLMVIDPDELKLLQLSIKIVTLSNDLLEKQSGMLTSINNKLDLLIKRGE